MDLALLCWVRGDDIKCVFTVKVPGEADMETLKEALKHKNPATFRDVDAKDPEVYCLFIPSDADHGVELGRWRLHSKEPLDADQQLSELFPKSHDGKWVVVVNYCACSVLHDI
ncbi:hypothetical protein EDC04DRAFT_2588125 [Pisolithus marmoratus]|nr:hypothetical protein EDC04DRAFT_2588125 [Pisolithus marmoratus]